MPPDSSDRDSQNAVASMQVADNCVDLVGRESKRAGWRFVWWIEGLEFHICFYMGGLQTCIFIYK